MHLILTPTLWGGAIAPHSAREAIISKAGCSDRCHCVTISYVSEPHGCPRRISTATAAGAQSAGALGPRSSHTGNEGQKNT